MPEDFESKLPKLILHNGILVPEEDTKTLSLPKEDGDRDFIHFEA